ncbi:MAG: type II toxin-antitoxin system RelE/ParE family toxin [Metallibacterium scheffleri]|uniref:Plasmid stabilization protein n=1 Tax=Metallibacterium scheffleri TaxID=993689 RepID=A0A4S3KNZ4_9GAMM|nr:type II toxin-antitoxin system RelE/ParE family toxin [Metallibacterium scheffleri]THD10659.1 plasmid stabilization protein [Metallibacterium scheffleri]
MKAYQVVLTPEALNQLRAIERYIAAASGHPMVAERYVDALVSYCESLATFPQRGARRDDIRPGLRLVPYRGSAEVAFVVDEEEVWIIGVFYGGQDYESALLPSDRER